ncbi:helix-turn-helix transcriptional regulator [Streptomyces sp. NPDC048277]|uniref:ArsR/SmtB family transcription factor n=1 Tax=Streptomyces sp. NPDC048277 TaxID=3155027 RepID=UPI0033CCBB60
MPAHPAAVDANAPALFKALADPVRWDILRQIAQAGVLPASVLEETLSVSKPTISYHVKILVQAGIVESRKESRNFYYSLREQVLHDLAGYLRDVVAAPPTAPREHTGEGPGQAQLTTW